eukprot:NODE_391_length_9459_cov_0.222970.p3 type:complete len:315 gc:universal NODE_391_length_9459_cov_0.222970:9272-8328(-)
MLQKVGVTILTGALGSGKSTMIKHILRNNKGLKIAVIINEVGENSQKIDQTLSEGTLDTETDDFKLNLLDLPSGCVCCTVRGATISTLERVVEQRPVDCIILETTGIADPGPIANDLWVDEALESSIRLDGIVTVVDAVNFDKHRKLDGNIRDKQIQYANIVVVNKYSERSDEYLVSQLTDINPTAKFMQTNNSVVDVADIVNNHFFSKSSPVLLETDGLHLNNYSILNFRFTVNLKKDVFEVWLMNTLWESKEYEVFRIKGYFAFDSMPCKQGLQGIMDTYEFYDLKYENVDSISEMIIIGKNLSQLPRFNNK